MSNKNVKEIPVYLFTGFLGSGKTHFIQETLEDPGFEEGGKTVLLLCEEGETEYNVEKFISKQVKIVSIEDEESLTIEYLENLTKLTKCDRVIVEYNGMWLLDTLYNALPENWMVYQEMTFFDSQTILSFSNNMRNIVVDKMKSSETVVFKNFRGGMDKMPFHKLVRVINRRCNIIYEYGPNKMEVDDIIDELPFDKNASVINVEDKDYALWYSDMNDNEPDYYGKTIKFKGRTLLGGGLLPDEFVIGRHIMACCANDVQFGGLVAKWPASKMLEHGGWIIMTADIVREYNKMYDGVGPVFHVKEVQKCNPPEEEVATFY